MAENNLKNQLDDIVAGKKQIQKNDNFFVTLSISEADFKSLSSKDLENIESILGNCEDYDLVAKIRYKIGERKKELGIVDAPEVQQEGQESQPSTADSQTKEDEFPHEDFMSIPSYSLNKTYHSLLDKYNNGEATKDQTFLINDCIDNAKKIVDLAANEEITPEQAVFLKDYLEILNSTAEKGKKYNEELEAKVDEQLKVFDEENGFKEVENISFKEIDINESYLHNIADEYIKNEYGEGQHPEELDIIKNLAIQELKLSKINSDKDIFKEVAQKANAPLESIVDLYQRGQKNRDGLSEAEQKVFDNLKQTIELNRENTLIETITNFDAKFKELQEQLEATRAIERAKLISEELYPEKPGMSEEDLEEIRKKREKYLEEQLSRKDGLPDKEKWIEENALRALRDKHHIADGDDEKIKADLKDEYEELRKAYSHIADEIDTATNTAYVLRVEALANRSARLTGADGLNPQTQKFVQDYAKKNKDSYKVGKMALSIGKSVALSQGVRYAFGFKGMAVYSAYQTSKAVKKSWAKYSESLPNGEKASLLGYCKYLKDNPKELTDIVSKVSKTAVMSSLAVAGTALGIDNVPGVSAAIVGGINAATAAVKIHQNKEAIKNTWNNRKQIAEDFKEKHPKLKKYGKWGAALLGVAAAGYAAYKIFAPDEVKDAVNDGMSDLDNDLLNNSNNENMTDAEREEILKNMENISKNGNGDITDPLNLKGGENTATENIGGENGENNAADAAQATEVPALTEADVKLMVTDCKMGPDPIVAKLESMGVLSPEDKEQLIGAGGRKDGVASRVLASYLGHPYDNTEVPVHANLTPEQQQELNQYLRSPEYQHECDNCNAAANARHLAKVRAAAEAAKQAAGGDGNVTNPLDQNGNIQQSQLTEYEYNVAQNKKSIFNIVNKSVNPQKVPVVLNKEAMKALMADELHKQGYTQEEINRQINKLDFDKISRATAAREYLKDNDVKRAIITDEDGSKHIYYRDKTNSSGEITSKRVEIDADKNKVTTETRVAKNGAEIDKYKGKKEVFKFIDENGKEYDVGGSGQDNIMRIVEDPKSGNRYTLLKGDDGKKYTVVTNIKTGHSKLLEGGSKSTMKRIFNDIKSGGR